MLLLLSCMQTMVYAVEMLLLVMMAVHVVNVASPVVFHYQALSDLTVVCAEVLIALS
jgi:hypothetical protein